MTAFVLGDIADLSWGDTSVTKKSYVTEDVRYPAFSASGNDGELPYFDYDRDAVIISAIGANAGATWLARGKWSCIKNTIRFFSRDENIADTRFLYWATLKPGTWPLRGSAQPFISQGDARKVEVILPPIEEQRAIAATLGALDDKIESNRRACDLLWSLIGASWEKLTEEASVRPLGDVLELVYGKSLPAVKRTHGSVPVYGSNGITGWHNDSLVSGPVVVVGRKGSIGEVHWSHVSAFPIDTTFYVRARDNYPLVACYVALRKAGLQSMNSDSAIPGLNRDRALQVRVTLPVLREATAWATNANLLVTQVAAIEEQTVTLETLRNDLLPELLSGRIRVSTTTEVVA